MTPMGWDHTVVSGVGGDDLAVIELERLALE